MSDEGESGETDGAHAHDGGSGLMYGDVRGRRIVPGREDGWMGVTVNAR